MRTVVNFNSKWAFTKLADTIPTEIDKRWCFVNVPHCWNAIDGQDGDNDFYRGKGYYAKAFNKTDLPILEVPFGQVIDKLFHKSAIFLLSIRLISTPPVAKRVFGDK